MLRQPKHLHAQAADIVARNMIGSIPVRSVSADFPTQNRGFQNAQLARIDSRGIITNTPLGSMSASGLLLKSASAAHAPEAALDHMNRNRSQSRTRQLEIRPMWKDAS